MKNNKKEIVISLYDRDLSWLSELNDDVKVTVYRKGDKSSYNGEIFLTPNVGRDVHTFFRHLYVNYYELSDITFFAQDYPFDHWGNLIEVINNDTFKEGCQLNIMDGYYGFHNNDTWMFGLYLSKHHGNGYVLFCSHDGVPHHLGVDVNGGWTRLFNDEYPFDGISRYEFIPGGHFGITKEHAHLRTRDFYGKVVEILENDASSPWVIERLECYIFNPKYKTII